MNQRNTYAKAMKGAYKVAEKTGTLGKGFGGEAQEKPVSTGSKVVSSIGKALSKLKK